MKMRHFDITLALCAMFAASIQGKEVVAHFEGKDLKTITQDGETGTIYIGGINELVQLHPNLTLSKRVTTGPKKDNQDCPPDPSKKCEEERRPTNYTTMLLAIDKKNKALISCSTLYYGFCEKYSVTDLSFHKAFYERIITDSELSVVGKITNGFGGQDLLYIGTAPTLFFGGVVRRSVPMLSSRNVDTLQIAHQSLSSASFIDYRIEFSKPGFVSFKEVFEDDTYVYYVTVQKDRVPVGSSVANYRSHLVRICKNDQNYWSYIQMPLKCDVWPQGAYNIAQAAHLVQPGSVVAGKTGTGRKALYVSFSQSFPSSETIKSNSALCVYSMDEIEQKFKKNLEDCFRGSGQIGPEFLKNRRSCQRNTANVGSSYCGLYDTNHPLEGSTAADPQLSISVGTDIVTSLLVKATGDTTLAYMGTTKGLLLKMIVQPNPAHTVYEKMQVAGITDSIRRPMLFDNDDKKENIILYTSSQVYKVKLYDCDQHTTCDTCLAGKEPHCGWCFRYNKCMTRLECPKSVPYRNYQPWLDYNSRCPNIIGVTPDPVGYDAIQNITMTVELDLLPEVPDGELFCELEAHIFKKKTPAKWQPGKNKMIVTCQPFQNLQALPNNQANLTAQLSVELGRSTGITWASAPLAVYDCSARSDSCYSCTSTQFRCTWCMLDNVCMSSNQKCPFSSTSVPGPSQLPDYSYAGTEKCPSIELVDDDQLLVHSGVNSKFRVKGKNFQSMFTDFKCKFKIQGQSKTTTASIDHGVISCDYIALEYSQNEPFELANFDVIWGPKSLKIDNPSDIQVKVYKCNMMEDHCGKCLVLDPEYKCGWCPSGVKLNGFKSSCGLQADCKSNWKNQTEDCKNVQILGITPKAGPVNGGTNITVIGRNMGKAIADFTAVKVAGVLCNIIEFEPSTRFVCVTGSAKRNMSGPVTVSIKNKYNGTSSVQYHYVDPILSDFDPKIGPISGGSIITISGRYLDVGNTVKVTIKGESCEVIKRSDSTLTFKTCDQKHPIEAKIGLEIDNSEEALMSRMFTYTEDPVINRIRPTSATLGGGNLLDIEGVNLKSIQKPKFYVIADGKLYFTDCLPPAPAFLQCPTPSLSHMSDTLKAPTSFDYGFEMDGVESVRNISSLRKFKRITYNPNPKLYKYRSVQKYKQNEKLTIQGINLLFLREFDLTVTVGGAICTSENVISSSSIQCDPPLPEKMKGKTDKNGNAEVMFILGNYKFLVGALKYSGGIPLGIGAIVGIVFGIVALIAILIIVFIVLHRRKKKAAKEKTASVIYNPKAKKVVNAYTENAADGPGPTDQLLPTPSADGKPEEKQDEETYISLVLSRLENQKLRRHVMEVLISRKRLELGETLGKGHFGQVFCATLVDSNMEHPKKVAVKTLQGSDLDQKQIENFLREGVIMKNFNHVHIMCLLGVCIGPNQEPMVILPFMANGDLRNYVKDKKKNFTARQLLHLAQQVAEGMAYLASLNFVHRDLAARNCMIDDSETVKVADFGLTREIYEREYYSLKDRKAKLPIKWMALESLEDFVFTTKSDVWSFGVLMWELMTRGVTPYPDVDAFDLRNYLASSRRLRKPKYCPDNVYKIMMDCWDEIPERRPTFADLVNRLELLLNPPKKRAPSQEESDYQNVDALKKDDYLNPVTNES